MASITDCEPPSLQPALVVGRDRAGHWLVQDSGGLMEGYFVSFAAASAFARAERHGFPGATIALATRPLSPRIAMSAPRAALAA